MELISNQNMTRGNQHHLLTSTSNYGLEDQHCTILQNRRTKFVNISGGPNPKLEIN